MNTTLNLSSLGASTGILAAGLIFMYGVWLGRRDLGLRAAMGVMVAVLMGGLLPMIVMWSAPQLLFPSSGGLRGSVLMVIWNIVSAGLAFLPWAVALNWLELLRREGPST
ncbi:hypothetical protein [Deinococcus grandis]|uniref:hypothetical protein n=1 Tax=Deinococcus grandis TaxID=57498 RepID=UPI00073EDAE6|nr:hypothetical protein [Deinococcus grandis]BBN96318.1 hypothetical protein DEGR_30510 [Deinococcus grandis]